MRRKNWETFHKPLAVVLRPAEHFYFNKNMSVVFLWINMKWFDYFVVLLVHYSILLYRTKFLDRSYKECFLIEGELYPNRNESLCVVESSWFNFWCIMLNCFYFWVYFRQLDCKQYCNLNQSLQRGLEVKCK